MEQKKGFTLIELIVVIAILGILALFLVPSFIGYAQDAKESVCNSNMTSIQRAYQFQLAKQESNEDKGLLEKVMKNEFDDFSTIPTCPTGGKYYVIDDGGDGVSAFKVACSEHSNVLGKIPTQIINQVSNLQSNPQLFAEYVEEYNKTHNQKINLNNKLSNDQMRALLKYINGGTWPTLEVNGKKYYIQPYTDLFTGGGNNPSGDTYVYASIVDSNSWNASYIYDTSTGEWWTGNKSIGFANLSFTEVKKKMSDAGWKVVENPQDLVITGQIVMP